MQARTLDAAIRAHSAGNTQAWRFLMVDHSDTKAKLGAIYLALVADRPLVFLLPERFGSTVFR